MKSKAIVKVQPWSIYSFLNGHTFEIVAIHYASVYLQVHDTKTNFSFDEIAICDLHELMQSAFDSYNWNGDDTYLKLQKYCSVNDYKVDVQYNCPA